MSGVRSKLHLGLFWVVCFVLLSSAELEQRTEAAEPLRDYDAIHIDVVQTKAGLQFVFSWEGVAKAPIQLKGPVLAWEFSIYSPKNARYQWRIVSPGGYPGVEKLIYGVVPDGFRQEVPTDGAPVGLEENEEYVASVRGLGGVGSARFKYVKP